MHSEKLTKTPCCKVKLTNDVGWSPGLIKYINWYGPDWWCWQVPGSPKSGLFSWHGGQSTDTDWSDVIPVCLICGHTHNHKKHNDDDTLL
jgi:hypothetical protein